jgi:hypothetical protein
MKKIYLSALALSLGSLSFGQNLIKKEFRETKLQKTLAPAPLNSSTGSSVVANKKAAGDTLWSEDFNNGFPAGWNSVDNTNNNAVWVLQPAGPIPDADFTSGVSTIQSTSGGNCMLLYGDDYNSPIPAGGYFDMDAYFQTSAINFSTPVSGVSVEFQQYFRRCCAINPPPVSVLAVSTDPTFPAGASTEEYDIIGGIGGNVYSPDPMNMSINISSIAANYTGDIYLRFHVKSGTDSYFWFIDDIAVVESQNNDIVTSQASYGFYGVEYTRLPANHIRPADFSMASNNIGAVDQPGSNLTVKINDPSGQVYTSSTNDTILPSLSIDTLSLIDNWTPPATPLNNPYTITLEILSDSTDATPANNEYTFSPLEITSNIMAIDDYSASPGSTSGNNGGEYEVGNQVDATVDDDVHAIQIVVGEDSQIGSLFDLGIYKVGIENGAYAYTELYRSGDANYEVDASMINVATDFRLEDASGNPTPLSLQADSTYFIVIHTYAGFEYAYSGIGPLPGTPTARHSSITTPKFSNPAANSTFSVTSTPMIRLNFDEQVGINQANETTQFNVYPNPSNGIFTINLDAELAKTVNLTVKNVVGQTIINKTVNVAGKTKETISLADYSKGVYFLTVDKKTVKVIVE